MRFGVCCGEERFGTAAEMGYDYVETVFSKFTTMTDGEYARLLSELRKYNLKSEACNCFFPSEMKLVGETADFSQIDSYVKKGMERAAEAGCKVAVIGSGGARRIPENFDRDKAVFQFCRMLNICGDTAEKYGVRIAIEPLNYDETNFINTVSEGLEICKAADNPNVGVLADFYHIYRTGETLDAVKKAGNLLFHVHLARPDNDRGVPYEPSDIDACKKWKSALEAAVYNGRLSLEAKYQPDFMTALERTGPAIKIFGKSE